jgi:DNA-binding SARP family transcriptional activator
MTAVERDLLLAVLGPCVVLHGNGFGPADPQIELSGLQRRILCQLAMNKPEAVHLDRLVEAVWGDDPPPTAKAALQNQIARIRTRLGNESILTVTGSYQLNIATDLEQVTDALRRCDEAKVGSNHLLVTELSRHSLTLWRGTPLEDLSDTSDVVGARRRYLELRRSFENALLWAEIELGHSSWAVPEAERLVGETPLDEHRWALQMRALDLAGRRGDALGAYERARRTLSENLGLTPGPELRLTQAHVLGVRSGSSSEAGNAKRSDSVIGRQALTDEIVAAIERMESIVLVGEAGIGKSRLLADIGHQIRAGGVLVASTQCALYPDTAVSSLTDLTDELGVAMDAGLGPVIAFATAVTDVLQTHGESPRRRMALVVDDIDRLGSTSATALVGVLAMPGVAMIASATDRHQLPPELDGIPLIEIPPLTELATSRLAAHLLADELPTGETAPESGWLFTMTGGNPALLECLLSDPTWRDQHVLGLGKNGNHLSTAKVLRDLVRTQIMRLSNASSHALDVAAICGDRCTRELLVKLSPGNGLAEAIRSSLLLEEIGAHGNPMIRFRHGAVERTVYDDISPGRRMDLHHRVAALLSQEGAPPSIIAAHSMAALSLEPLLAADRAIDAGRDASTHGAHVEAADWYWQAAEAATTPHPNSARVRVTALVGQADSLRLCGSVGHEQALFAAADAAFDLGNPNLVGDAAFAVLQLGATSDSGEMQTRAIEVAERALRIIVDTDQRALVAAAASLTHSMTGESDLCRRLFLEAERDAQSVIVRRRVIPFAYLAIGHPQDLDLRVRLTEEIIASSRLVGDSVGLFEGLQLAFSNGLQRADGTAVREVVTELERLVLMVGDVGRRWSLAYQQAALAHLEGDLEQAESFAEQALEIFSPVAPTRAFATYGAQLLVIRAAQGRLPELTDALRGLVIDQPGIPAWHAALAYSLATTDPLEARHHAGLAVSNSIYDFTWLAGQIIGGRAAAQVCNESVRAQYRENLEPWSGLVCWQGTCAYGPVDTVLAMLAVADGDSTAANRYVRSAVATAFSLGSPLFADEAMAVLT